MIFKKQRFLSKINKAETIRSFIKIFSKIRLNIM